MRVKSNLSAHRVRSVKLNQIHSLSLCTTKRFQASEQPQPVPKVLSHLLSQVESMRPLLHIHFLRPSPTCCHTSWWSLMMFISLRTSQWPSLVARPLPLRSTSSATANGFTKISTWSSMTWTLPQVDPLNTLSEVDNKAGWPAAFIKWHSFFFCSIAQNTRTSFKAIF